MFFKKSVQKKDYTIVLCGCGRVAEKHFKALKTLKKRIKSLILVENNNEVANHFIQRNKITKYFPNTKIYQDLDTALDNPADIVVISTPSATHYKLAKKALEKACHLFLEKPATLDLTEAIYLKELAEKQKRVIAMGHIYRFFPFIDMLSENLKNEKENNPQVKISTEFFLNWGHSQAYYDAAAWRGTWLKDGGVLMNQSIHAMDLICHIMPSNVQEISAQIEQKAHSIETEDSAKVSLFFETGDFASLEASTAYPETTKEVGLFIKSPKLKACLKKDKKNVSFQVSDASNQSLKLKYIMKMLKQLKKHPILQIKAWLNPHLGIYIDLLNAIEEKRQPKSSIDDGILSLKLVLGAYKSAKLQKPVQLNEIGHFSLKEMLIFFD